jgi:hypothetical protein
MGPTELLGALHRKPFEPFRIVTLDGTHYDIHSPKLVMVTLRDAIIGFPHPTIAGVLSRFDILGLEYLVRLEELPPPGGKPAGNGAESV